MTQFIVRNQSSQLSLDGRERRSESRRKSTDTFRTTPILLAKTWEGKGRITGMATSEQAPTVKCSDANTATKIGFDAGTVTMRAQQSMSNGNLSGRMNEDSSNESILVLLAVRSAYEEFHGRRMIWHS